MTTLQLANIIYPIFAVLGMLLLAHRKQSAFIILTIVDVLLFYIGYNSGQQGISTMAIMYLIMNAYGYKQWGK